MMSNVPPDTVWIRHARVRSLNDSNRGVHTIRFAAVDGQHAELLNGDDHLLSGRIQRKTPGLVRNVQTALRRQVSVRIVVENCDPVLDVVVYCVDFPARPINLNARDKTELGLRTNDLPHRGDRKSTRLNSSHGYISYAVFCLKKK